MTEDLQKFEKSIKKEGKFGWTPKYKAQINTGLEKRLFVELATKTFEEIGWDIVFRDDESVMAVRRGSLKKATEKITASYQSGDILVESESLGNELWDMGRNSKRVKLFIHVYTLMEKDCEGEKLALLKQSVERQDNWDDCVIPDELPKP